MDMKTGFKNASLHRSFHALMLFFLSMTGAYGQDVIVQPVGTTIENGRHDFKLQVWNCTNSDIEVPLADLPWGENKLGLVVYHAGKLAGEPLKEGIPIADFPDTTIKIQAKSHVEGSVDLDSRFLDIARVKNPEDLLIFWEYDLSLIVGGHAQYVGGMVPFNRTSSSRTGPTERTTRTACK
jgi:hypothetical protein